MRSNAAILATVLGRSLVSIACCFIVGLVIFQSKVFHPFFWSSQLLVFSVVGSVFFYSLRINRRNAFAVLLVMYVIQAGLIFRHIQPAMQLANAVFFLTLGATLYVFFVSFYTKSVNYRNLQPLVLATLFAIAFSLATLVIGFLDGVVFRLPVSSSLADAVFANARYEFLVGLGIGLGVLLLDNGYVAKAESYIGRVLGSVRATSREFGDRL
jgi:hypothetical protein